MMGVTMLLAATLQMPVQPGLNVNDSYSTCVMVSIGRKYPDGPTGSIAERERAFGATLKECAPIADQVDAKMAQDARRNGMALTIPNARLKMTRDAIRNGVRGNIGLPPMKFTGLTR